MKLRAPILVMLTLVGGVACYNPTIGEGDFLCGPAGECPQNWTCGADQRCHRLAVPSDGAPSDTAPPVDRTAPVDLVPDAGPPPPPPPPPVDAGGCNRPGISCSAGAPSNRPCDLVCQTGCPCNARCLLDRSAFVCQPIPQQPLDFFAECNPGNDLCRAGAICAVEQRPDVCRAHCYRACRVDADCGMLSRCSDQLLDGAGQPLTRICGPRIETCNPVGARPECSNSGAGSRPFPSFGCYLVDASIDEATTCDCAGTFDLGAPCVRRHQCRPGLECLPPLGAQGPLTCRQLCNLNGQGPPCAAGVCLPIGNGARYGACM